MRKIYALLFAAFPLLSFGQCGDRYRDFIAPDYTRDADIVYGSNISSLGDSVQLKMDVYTPSVDSTHYLRPLIIFVHGGSFTGGTKRSGVQEDFAKEFARKGYVTASIDYRLQESPNPDVDPIFEFADKNNWYKSITRASQDVKAAIRFLKKDVAENGNKYRIDTNNIVLYGSSAGAIAILHTVFLTDR